MTKKCTKCKQILNRNEFNWRIKNVRLASHCKTCSREYVRQHYYKNKNYYLNKARNRNLKVKQEIYEYLGKYFQSHPCIDCNETNILVLEFDHIDKNDKVSDISRILRNRLTLTEVKKEITKCVVRCANCHRIKTAREDKSWRLKFAPVAQLDRAHRFGR